MSKTRFFSALALSLLVITSGLPAPSVIPQETSDAERKLINTPTICKNGEELDANGECHEITKRSAPQVMAPCVIDCNIPGRDCPDGQEMDEAGNCRDVWGRKKREAPEPEIDASTAAVPETSTEKRFQIEPECIIDCNIPNKCPDGQKPDPNGNCRDEWPVKALEDAKETEGNDEEGAPALTRAMKRKNEEETETSDSKPQTKSVGKIKVAKAKVAKAKVVKAKVVKGKTFMMIKKKKKGIKKPEEATTAAPDVEPGDEQPPFPFPFPEQPPPDDDALLNRACAENQVRDASGMCRSADEVVPVKRFGFDSWETWETSESSESSESSDSSEEETEEEEINGDTWESWESEELNETEEEPYPIDDKLVEDMIEMKLIRLMKMLEMKRRYGDVIGHLLEEEEKRKKKRS